MHPLAEYFPQLRLRGEPSENITLVHPITTAIGKALLQTYFADFACWLAYNDERPSMICANGRGGNRQLTVKFGGLLPFFLQLQRLLPLFCNRRFSGVCNCNIEQDQYGCVAMP